MNQRRCFHAPLAKNGVGKMDYCASCGVVTIHLGAISMRFDPESAESVWALLSQGLAALREELSEGHREARDKMLS